MLDKFNKRRHVDFLRILSIVTQDLLKMMSAWSLSIASEHPSEMLSTLA